jgi:dipeptidyl aminopeptidase/acylaminoacyl peptidase
MRRSLLLLPAVAFLLLDGLGTAREPPAPKLLVGFASYRERATSPNIYFYEHDGVAHGKIVGMVESVKNVRIQYTQPSLSRDARLCAFTFQVTDGSATQAGLIRLWDREERKLIDLPGLNTLSAQMNPSLSGDGQLLAFAAWNRIGSGRLGWHVFLYNRAAKKLLDLPDLNSPSAHDQKPALNGPGRFLAFTSNRKGGAGLTDTYLYDRQESKLITLPEMNSKHMDSQPAVSADGNLIAFTSDRRGTSGSGRHIYLFDRSARKLVPLPGLNSVGQEHSPSLSPDGRFLTFVSERLGGEGQRDIYLYDRQTQKLLPTPGLNSKVDDFDPCVMVLPE